MARIRTALRRIFVRPVWQTALIAPVCFALLGWVLTHDTPPVADHIAYQLSVYALAISVTAALRVVPALRARLSRSRLIHSPLGYLFRRDVAFRAWLTLCLSIAWNLLYALAKLIVGAALGSAWLKLMGCYYLALAAVRFIIVGPAARRPAGPLTGAEPPESEWRRYRLCGFALLLMNQLLVVVVVRVLTQRGGFSYPGPLIYLMALYTFWAVANATVRLARYHRRDDPLMSAAKAVSLTAAMVSMLSLETALIDRFGDGAAAFHYIMTGALGGAICLIELNIALYMIRRGNRMIGRVKKTFA